MMKLLNPRGFGLACATIAVGTGLVVAGCSNAVHGTATVDQADAAAYRTEMASSSAAATSSRRAAAQAKAVSDNCTPFRDTTGVAVTKYNEFVDAHDNNAPDQDAKRDASAETLENAAKTVEGRVSAAGDALPPDLAQKFTDYVVAARALAAEARKMTYTAPVGPLNDASKRVNDALNEVRNACPAR
ncbi:hypothetical protein NDR87_08565 [Nocardia sp. CDC159]|uniref:Lipoprotein n=1 Tax=Nocardia pulmonis TaxID=2951408 RepID=A0A9X2E637_9NOCA|nr:MULTISPECIES: hypothetical protein [Nocardia]MCM6773520.1 hypothetical protein [Nocardia pulmonis]MCM6786407.1 hypothetical protein [Nocardia sp. CDC159]